jgi:DNA polymerase (family 10)
MDNDKIIDILDNIAVLLQLKGENEFKARAYSSAAESIRIKNINIDEEVKNGTLGEIKGFGKALVSKLTELSTTGNLAFYQNLIEEVPLSLIDLTSISGIGVKKARQLWKELSIRTIDELEDACMKQLLRKLKGFTDKTEEMILNSIEHKKASKGRYTQQAVKVQAEQLWKLINELEFVNQITLTGDVRRFVETIKELHFIVAVDSPESAIKQLEQILKADLTLTSIDYDKFNIYGINQYKVPIKFQIVSEHEYPVILHNTTGNSEYLNEFMKFAESNDIIIEDKRILQSNHEIYIEKEHEIYELLNIDFIPPELRETANVLNFAKEKNLPKLIESSDLKGMIHVHSTWSDGRNTIKEMALKSKQLGFEYMVLCDHSKSAGYANGLTADKVKAQHYEIDKLNEENLGIKIIKGIESDILTDGSLDYDDNTLSSFEVIISSIHQGFKMSKSDMTKRIIKAIKNPFTTMIGHPTGRLLTVRQGYDLDIKEIIDCAADYGKIIEINCNPYRLDLSWENIIYAKSKGMKTSINPDSHKIETLSDVFIGVSVARKGWLEANDVVNCLNYEEFFRFIGK